MKLFYRTYGTGPALIILHGLLGLSDNWAGIAKDFSRTFRVILPDLRNHGNSPHHPEFDYPHMVEDIKELMDSEKILTADFIGHSMGGRLLMHFINLNPERVRKSIIVDISPLELKPNIEVQKLLHVMITTNIAGFNSFRDLETTIRKNIQSDKLVGLMMKNVRKFKDGRLEWKPDLCAISANLDKITGEIPTPHLPYFGPVMIIKGALSDYIGTSAKDAFRNRYPNSELIEIEHAGHWVHAEQSTRFTESCLNYLCSL